MHEQERKADWTGEANIFFLSDAMCKFCIDYVFILYVKLEVRIN